MIDYKSPYGHNDKTIVVIFCIRCVCCPNSSTQTEDMRFRAILERLDDIESHMTEVTHSRNPSQFDADSTINVKMEEENQPFSKQNGIFEGAVERSKIIEYLCIKYMHRELVLMVYY